jgi:hypothetical protein
MTNHPSTPSKPTLMRDAAVMLAIGAVFAVGACQPKSSEGQSKAAELTQSSALAPSAPAPVDPKGATEPDTATTSTAKSAPPKSDAEAAGGAVSLAGGWVNAGGACDSGASVFFNPDGTYMSEGEKGTWKLAGKTLTVTTTTTFDEAASPVQGPDESTGDTGEKSVLTLLSVTDDAARVVLANGSAANWTRCTS